MIESFKHKGLERFFTESDKRAIPAQSAARIERLLDRLEASIKADDMDLPGNKFHALNPDGHLKLLHSWPPKLPQAGRIDYGAATGLKAIREAASLSL